MDDTRVDQTKIMNEFVEVELPKSDDFLRIAETLTRIGVKSADGTKLYQSAHILHKRGRYYIVSFKEMFLLDGKANTFTEEDKHRRNKIANLLQGWGLLKIKDASLTENVGSLSTRIDVIPYKDKSNYILVSKYTIGKKRAFPSSETSNKS